MADFMCDCSAARGASKQIRNKKSRYWPMWMAGYPKVWPLVFTQYQPNTNSIVNKDSCKQCSHSLWLSPNGKAINFNKLYQVEFNLNVLRKHQHTNASKWSTFFDVSWFLCFALWLHSVGNSSAHSDAGGIQRFASTQRWVLSLLFSNSVTSEKTFIMMFMCFDSIDQDDHCRDFGASLAAAYDQFIL